MVFRHMVFRKTGTLILMVLTMVLTIVACNDAKVDTTLVKDEMESRQIKRITAGQVNALIEKKGRLYAQYLDTLFAKHMHQSLQNPIWTVENHPCQEKWIKAIDTLEKTYGIRIERLQQTEAKERPKTWEVYDAYLYNHEHGLPNEDNIQKMGETEILYTKPIILSQKECFQCHGKQAKHVMDTYKLPLNFPQNSTLFAQDSGALLGVWHMVFDKKTFIKKISIKDIKSIEL